MFDIHLTPIAEQMLLEIGNRRTRQTISNKIAGLVGDPGIQGGALRGEFSGLRKVPAAGRYRVVYRIEASDSDQFEGRVVVVAIGIRQAGGRHDIYEQLRRMVGRGEA